MDLLVPDSKREKDTVQIREEPSGGIKVSSTAVRSSIL